MSLIFGRHNLKIFTENNMLNLRRYYTSASIILFLSLIIIKLGIEVLNDEFKLDTTFNKTNIIGSV